MNVKIEREFAESVRDEATSHGWPSGYEYFDGYVDGAAALGGLIGMAEAIRGRERKKLSGQIVTLPNGIRFVR